MLIVCPSCATSYQVEPHSLGENGRSVRCARCRNVWFATTPAVVATLPGSDAWDVVDTGPRVPAVDTPPVSLPSEPAAPSFVTTGDIDMTGLRADLDGERNVREAEADAVLAEVAQESAEHADGAMTDSPPLGPAQDSADAPRTPPEDVFESFAQRRARRKAKNRKPRPKLGLPILILLLAGANASLVAWRNDIARFLPQTASLYSALGIPVNLRGLIFENMQISRIEQEGVGVLVVEGSIVNITKRSVEVPRLRLSVRNEANREIYSWTALPSRSILEPGDNLPFRARLASPPADGREVQVRFFNKRDMTAGLN